MCISFLQNMLQLKFLNLIAVLTLTAFDYSKGQKNMSFCTSEKSVDYLVNLITETEAQAQTYQLPKNARQYGTDGSDTTYYGTYDFIIVGAGSAGTVIANRLSEVPQWKILLLEAGDFGNCLTNIPDMLNPSYFTKYNWGFLSTPQKTSCLGMIQNRCPLARGKGVGGTTLINGLVYSRGSKLDFDRWAQHVNDSIWSYDVVLDYFKKSENFTHRDENAPVYEPVHGKGGYLHVEYHLPRSPQLNAFLEANEELGLPIADYNAGTGLGASPAQINTEDGSRFDGGRAFIDPILNRDNLEVLTNSYVTKILIHKSNKTAYGVAFNHRGKAYTVTASKEVIVSGGAISTPQILMLSGIGPKKHLQKVNIPVIQNLEVGSKLRDHPTFFGINFGTNYTEPIKPLKEYVEEFIAGYGPLATPGENQGVGFYESQFTAGTGYPDIELMLIPANATSDVSKGAFNLKESTYDDVWKKNNLSQTFMFYIAALHSESTGSVRLKSNDPLEYPIINTNFLSDPKNKDIKTIYEGVQLVLKMSTTRAFKKINTKLQGGPLRACKQYNYPSEKYWYCAIRQMTLDLYHPVATCPMGQYPEKGDVVNSRLQVHGVGKLRIGDASVFPFTFAGHPNAPTVMVGEVLSDILKEEYAY